MPEPKDPPLALGVTLRAPDPLAALVRALPEAAALVDAEGRVVCCNAGARELAHATVGQPLGHALRFAEPGADLARADVARLLGSGRWDGPRRLVVNVAGGGGLRQLELTAAPFEAGGSAWTLVVMRDRSRRTQDQATIALLHELPVEAAAASGMDEASRVCLERISRYAAWPVAHAYVVSGDGDQLVSNGQWQVSGPGFERFVAATEAARVGPGRCLPGRAWAQRAPVWVSDVTADPSFERRAEAAACGLRSGFALPVQAAGELFAVLEFFTPAADPPDPALLDVLATVADQLGRLFEKQRAAARLREAYEQLKQANQARVRLLNTAAHELATPLVPIGLQVELLRSRSRQLGDADRRSLEMVARNVQRLQLLVQDLLDASRIEAGRLRLQPDTFDLALEAQRVCQAFEPVARAAEVGLACETRLPVLVTGDARRTAQVLDNLLSNAAKFTPPGGRVVVRVRADGPYGVCEVEDTGVGFDPLAAEDLFQPFHHAHETPRMERTGSGLGLFISRGIVEASGGDLRASSPGPGLGARFTFRLPMERAQASLR
ncbi:MAG TPA: ATP-binding protein [Candidatus Thermoplasmatota archaeon]|nr:ATP-binding protein [Candidatus Thermoplasmatota archaeon]